MGQIINGLTKDKAGYNIGFATSGADGGSLTVLHFITFVLVRHFFTFKPRLTQSRQTLAAMQTHNRQ